MPSLAALPAKINNCKFSACHAQDITTLKSRKFLKIQQELFDRLTIFFTHPENFPDLYAITHAGTQRKTTKSGEFRKARIEMRDNVTRVYSHLLAKMSFINFRIGVISYKNGEFFCGETYRDLAAQLSMCLSSFTDAIKCLKRDGFIKISPRPHKTSAGVNESLPAIIELVRSKMITVFGISAKWLRDTTIYAIKKFNKKAAKKAKIMESITEEQRGQKEGRRQEPPRTTATRPQPPAFKAPILPERDVEAGKKNLAELRKVLFGNTS